MKSRLKLLLLVSGLVLVVLGTRAATTKYDPRGQQASPAARAALTARASTMAAQVMSYNAETAESDIAAAKDLMTESMQADYDRTLPPEADRKRQAKSKVKIDARVSRLDGVPAKGGDKRRLTRHCPRPACAVGIVSMTSDKAEVLVFVNQYATAASTKNTLVNPTWEIIRLVRRDGRWLIDEMEAP